MVRLDGGPLGGPGLIGLRRLREEILVLVEGRDGAVFLQAQEGVTDVAPVAGRGDAERPVMRRLP